MSPGRKIYVVQGCDGPPPECWYWLVCAYFDRAQAEARAKAAEAESHRVAALVCLPSERKNRYDETQHGWSETSSYEVLELELLDG